MMTDSPCRTLADVIAAARAQPEAISYGITGIGSHDHLAVLAFERQAGVKQALLGRTIAIGSVNVADGVQESRLGLMRMLGQMGERRTEVAGDIPTFREAGFDMVEGFLRGMAAPAGVPRPVLERLSLAVRRTVENPEFRANAAQQMLPLRFLGPDDYLAERVALRVKYQALWAEHPWRE